MTEPAEDAALTALAAALSDPGPLTQAWRDEGRIEEDDDDVVRFRTGSPDPQQLERFAAIYDADHEQPLPRFYVRLLSTYNGIEVGRASPDTGEDAVVVPPRELREPSLWPIGTWGDHLALASVDLEGIVLAFVFGERFDSGYLVFDAASGDAAPVFWVPRRFASTPPTRIADSLAEFVSAWCACHLDVPALLRRARVPGWGG
jgi:hypothetical protein